MTYTRKLPGVTLIELLIVMAILPLLLILVSSMFGTFIEGQERATAQAAINQEQQYLLEKINSDISQASDILFPVADGATAPVLRLQHESDVIEYLVSGVTLVRSSPAGAIPVTTTRVLLDAFSVQRLGSLDGKDSARITLTLTSTASAELGEVARTLTTTHTLR